MRSRLRPDRAGGALLIYVALALLLFGVPILAHPASHVLSADDIDSSEYMWAFAWLPHALLHGQDPFVTYAMFVPDGFNLTWMPTMPGPNLLLAPLTLAFGPAVTWNAIMLLSPALSGWTAWLLCRHVSGDARAALVGGYLFGFSPYMLGQLTGAPNLALVAVVPLLVLLVIRRVQGLDSPRRFVALSTLALLAQFSISTEILATTTLFGGIALVVAYVLDLQRRELLHTAALLVVAYVLTGVIASPWLALFLFGHQYPPGRTFFPADVTSLVLPPGLVALTRPPHGLNGSLRGSNTQSYLGLPLLVLMGLFAWEARRRRITWVIIVPAVLAVVFSLGAELIFHGRRTGVNGPWWLLHQLPIFRYVIPIRLVMFALLAAAVACSLWLAWAREAGGRGVLRRPWLRWALAALVVASFVPAVGDRAWNFHIGDPAFFAGGRYHHYLRASDNVLTVPAFGRNERWQADTRFAFSLSAGYLGNPFPPSYTRYPIWTTLVSGRLIPDYQRQLRRFLIDKRVTAVVVDKRNLPGVWPTLFGTLGVRPADVGGVLVYRLRATAGDRLP